MKKEKKRIGKKILGALLGIGLVSLLMTTTLNLFQFGETKTNIGVATDRQIMALSETVTQVMTATNTDMATMLAQTYSESIDSKFMALSRQVMLVQNYLLGVYTYGAETVSRFPEDMYYLQPGVVYEDIESELKMIKSVRDIMAGITASDPHIAIYYVSEKGLLLADRYVDYSGGQHIDRRKRPWYTGAAAGEGMFWEPVYKDALSGQMTITCSAPVIDENGDLRGVVGCDILVGPLINHVLNDASALIQYTFLLDAQQHDFVGTIADKTLTDLIGVAHKTLFVEEITKNRQGTGLYQNDKVMIGYALIPSTGWYVGVLMDYALMAAPSQQVRSVMDITKAELLQYLDDRLKHAALLSMVMAGVMILFVLLISNVITRSITKPLRMLAEGVEKISGGNITHTIRLKSNDEMESLADAFNAMTGRLQAYMANLAKVTAERERIAAELNVAKEIQADMLPNIFPAFPERAEFEIYASMQPAKEVGGDFYDFFLIDENRLGIVIADVSGKGVPAALFMVIAKTLINNCARTMKEPQDIFMNVNRQLCEGNETAMFVTAWLGILEINTRRLTYVNAGHNPPLIKRAGGTYEYLPVKKGCVLAFMDGMAYTQSELCLNTDEMLYLYTDGVTEANNEEEELYGEQRLQSTLNRLKDLPPAALLSGVKADLAAFAGEAPPFDDITMLALWIK